MRPYNEEQSLSARSVVYVLVLTAVDGGEDFILFLCLHTQALKSFSNTAVWADKGFVVSSGKCRMSGVGLSALGADGVSAFIRFH